MTTSTCRGERVNMCGMFSFRPELCPQQSAFGNSKGIYPNYKQYPQVDDRVKPLLLHTNQLKCRNS